ncbi:hypothetical protein K491DRAFT_723924 [Lophiostoma macrostomum CBS 122681]|uniref:Uncharacterized protein n=1 Tax=Lophiostoma macrostomum CBS 122681 TaxID=1314788 RepID=A0A6A6SJ01_9PLEO|nr:hypothetical protein K491DRAFT_723924 [Lophiostoma macrostomum CBS 122681]
MAGKNTRATRGKESSRDLSKTYAQGCVEELEEDKDDNGASEPGAQPTLGNYPAPLRFDNRAPNLLDEREFPQRQELIRYWILQGQSPIRNLEVS